MSTKEQRSELIQGLQDYLDNTPPEQLKKEWRTTTNNTFQHGRSVGSIFNVT